MRGHLAVIPYFSGSKLWFTKVTGNDFHAGKEGERKRWKKRIWQTLNGKGVLREFS